MMVHGIASGNRAAFALLVFACASCNVNAKAPSIASTATSSPAASSPTADDLALARESLFLKSFAVTYKKKKNVMPSLALLANAIAVYESSSDIGRAANAAHPRTAKVKRSSGRAALQLTSGASAAPYQSNLGNYTDAYVQEFRRETGQNPSSSQIAAATSYWLDNDPLGQVYYRNATSAAAIFPGNPEAQLAMTNSYERAASLATARVEGEYLNRRREEAQEASLARATELETTRARERFSAQASSPSAATNNQDTSASTVPASSKVVSSEGESSFVPTKDSTAAGQETTSESSGWDSSTSGDAANSAPSDWTADDSWMKEDTWNE